MLSDFPTVEQLNYAYGQPLCKALFKHSPQDFYVEEQLHYELTGSGEHLYVYIEKSNQNTQDIKFSLAKQLGLPVKQIAEAGLKDKHATTRQWLSLPWPIKEPLPTIEGPFTVLKMDRHIKKLKKGAFGQNIFKIKLYNLDVDPNLVEARLSMIQTHGFPNYFGKQRFGNKQSNLENFMSLVEGRKLKRHARSLAISSARSFLFNQMLSELIAQHGWPIDSLTHGLLWGKSNKGYKDELVDVASSVTGQYTKLSTGLENLGAELSFRLLSVIPSNMTWQWTDASSLCIDFGLPPGCFATALLRELFSLEEQVCES